MATFGSLLWDPATSASGYTITFQGLVYDRLVHTAPDGSLVPGLAESWEYSADGTVLTFHLREGVTFQDGARLRRGSRQGQHRPFEDAGGLDARRRSSPASPRSWSSIRRRSSCT